MGKRLQYFTKNPIWEIFSTFVMMNKVKALIPNLLTAGNLLGGVLAIIFALTGRLEWAPYCIFISAILDFFDGFVARLLKVQSELGKQLDSLADMVTFGVAPGVIVYQLIKLSVISVTYGGVYNNHDCNPVWHLNPDQSYGMTNGCEMLQWPEFTDTNILLYQYLPWLALLIPVMSMFRLAKFNLDTRQSDSFIGLPTPANTLFFAVAPLLIFKTAERLTAKDWILDTTFLNPWFLGISIIVMSCLLVAELPLFALKFKSFNWKGNEIRYIFLTLAVVLLATLHWLAIPILIILYILLSVIQNILLRQRP